MQRRNTTLLFTAVAVLVLAAVLWRLAGGDPEPPPEPGGGQPPPVVPEPNRPPPSNVRFDGPRVVVTAVSRERFAAPRGCRAQAVQLPSRDPLPTTMLAGTGANPWASTPRPGVALVKIAVDGGYLVRQAKVETGVTEVGLGSMLAVTGKVHDRAGEPIADARVWLGELYADGRNRHLHTDDEGTFEARVRAGDGVPLTVWASGHAAAWRPVNVRVDGERHYTVTLDPGGTLAMQIAGQAVNMAGAEILIAPTAVRSAGLSRYPFFLQEMVRGADLNASGSGATSNLPHSGVLALTVMHPQVAIRQHHEVKLEGERTACVVPLKFAPAWSSSISNDAGEPLANAAVLLRPEGRPVRAGSGLKLLPPRLEALGCYLATSDAEGRFTCARPAKGDVLSLRAPGHGGRDIEIGDAAPESLWLPKWVGGEPVLTVMPPVAGTPWRAEFALAERVVIDCEADKTAVIVLPHAGLFDLVVTTFVGEQERGRREYAGVSATGPVVVPAPKIE